MIKFKKMSTFAKVASIGGVTAVVGVAFIPVINKFIDNPKSKVNVFEFNNRLFKTKEAAEAARMKFTAMSGLISAMNADQSITPNLDYKPLMAEFVSFVSKMFVVKVFQMDDDTTKDNHFKYDGMTEGQKQDIFQKEIEGEIHYGDLTDVTSLVKYANAHKKGNEWMFTPVDEMMLSILGDGSGQAYSENELKYADVSKTITALKIKYDTYYKTQIKDNFNGIAYSLVRGVTHHNDDELEAADHTKNVNINEGDGSGDEYTADLIEKYKNWGKLKLAFENAKKDLDDYVSLKNITPALKDVYTKMVAGNAVTGWNNKERYSTDEITLRDLLAKLATENLQVNAKTIPGGHQDTNTNIVKGWNWEASGDRTDRDYADWQLQLAKDIQNREKLISLHLTSAPAGAVEDKNWAATGDGTGNHYDQSVFDVAKDFKDTGDKIAVLTDKISMLINSGVIAAPDGAPESPTGKHIHATGLKDGVDYSNSWATHTQLLKLEDDLAKAKQAHQDLLDKIAKTTFDITPGTPGGVKTEDDLLNNIIDFDAAQQGDNYKINYNGKQVDFAQALDLQKGLVQEIADLQNNGVKAAPVGAVPNNIAGLGLQNNMNYAPEQIQLRDKIAEQARLGVVIKQSADAFVRRAKTGGKLSQAPGGVHVDKVGLADNIFYSTDFVGTAAAYRSLASTLFDLKKQIADVVALYPTLSDQGVSFQDLHDNHAQSGENFAEQYSQKEKDYTDAGIDLSKLQTALADANKALGQFHIDSSKAAQLKKDYDSKLTPVKDENFKPDGDKTDHTYTAADKAYYDDLKKLKSAFPNGNPWWTTTSDKKSEDAYAALFNDWHKASEDGTEKHNSPVVGDGTDHVFDSNRFKIYETYLKDSILKLSGTGHDADNARTDFDTIIKYIQQHGGLETNNGPVAASESSVSTGSTVSSGDASGFEYLKIDDIYNKVYDAYLKPGNLKSKLASANYWNNLYIKNKGKLNDYKQQLSDAETAKAAYQKAYDDLAKKIVGPAATLADLKTDLQKLKDDVDKYTGYHGSLKNVSDADKIALAAMDIKDNHAKLYSGDQNKFLAELNGIGQKISDAKDKKDDADDAYTKLREQNNLYKIYTQHKDDFADMVVDRNWAATGDGSGNQYDADHINGRNLLKEIKEEITKANPIVDVDDEVKKLRNYLKENSEIGINGDGTGGHKSSGDTSGRSWEKWEVDLYGKVSSLNTIISRIGSDDFPPEDAVIGINHKLTGDGSGNTYDSVDEKEFIKNYAPALIKALKDQKDANKALKDLKDRKSTLEGMHLSSSSSIDPNKYYVTSTGKKYTITQFNDAKLWLSAKGKYDAKNTDVKTAQDAVNKVTKVRDDYKKDHYDSKWDDVIGKASNVPKSVKWWIRILDPNKGAEFASGLVTAQNAMNAADEDIKKSWWNDNKGKSVGPKGSPFENYKISTDYDKFTAAATKGGSFGDIHYKLKQAGANLDGTINTKPTSFHTQPELNLRDALNRFVADPSGTQPKDITFKTEIFYSLLQTYKHSADHNYWAKNNGYSAPKNLVRDEGDFYHKYGVKPYKFKDNEHTVFSGDSVKLLPIITNFEDWVKNSFTDKTERKNSPKKGNGKDEEFDNEKFFSYNHHKITADSLINTDLGEAAAKVNALHGKVQKMTSSSKEGNNPIGKGDKSGKTYDDNDLAYFAQYKATKLADKAVTDKQDEIKKMKPTDGTFLIHIPAGYTGAIGATHIDPVGDGSGHTYDPKLIQAVKTYFAYKDQEEDQQKQIDTLEKEWNAKKGEPNWKDWATLISIPSTVAPGLNHEIWWSQAELDYDGNNISNAKVAQDIKDLQGSMIPDPTVKPGTPNPPLVKATPAPDGAVEGFNAKPVGLANGSTYDSDQITKRDELEKMNHELTDVKAIIAKYKTDGVNEAPDPDITAVPDDKWHEFSRGDATGNFYDQKIFDDKAELKVKADAEKAASTALSTFITTNGQAKIDQIKAEVSAGMINGVNEKEQYSSDEIALREAIASKGDADSHLALVKSNGEYGVAMTLTPKSKVGDNIAKVGIGDDVTYTKSQITLRDLIIKINDEERIHNIISERDFATCDVFDPIDPVGKAAPKTMTESVLDFYNGINLNTAKVGANHEQHGDASNIFYTSGDITTFNDIVSLQTAIAQDSQAIQDLQDKGVKPAPSLEVVVDKDDTTDASLWGKHVKATGDKTGNTYTQDEIDTAYKYIDLLNIYNKAKPAFDNFVAANPNEVKFFEFKRTNGVAWTPIAGRNWADYQFDLRDQIDKRDALKVGRTTVNIGDGTPSEFGTNRGHLGGDAKDSENVVMYEGTKDNIKNEIVGSDKVRIGYVLNPSGSAKPAHDAPVLDSLEAVAHYIQEHKNIAPKGLIERFALLQQMGTADTKDIYKIKETTVSKDRFNAMAENYQWGDK